MRVLDRIAITALALVGAGSIATAQSPHAPYSGQRAREIKALSDTDVRELERGAGWGLAKPAELNGYPGPVHVLELAETLRLGADQKRQIDQIYAKMNAEARSIGQKYLAAEKELDRAFASRAATHEAVQRLTAEAGRLRAELRAVHLRAHIETTPLLTPHQRHQYAALRGYADAAPQGGQPYTGHKHH